MKHTTWLPLLLTGLLLACSASPKRATVVPTPLSVTPPPATILPTAITLQPTPIPDHSPQTLIARVVQAIADIKAASTLNWSIMAESANVIHLDYPDHALVNTSDAVTTTEDGVWNATARGADVALKRQVHITTTETEGQEPSIYTLEGEARQVDGALFFRAAYRPTSDESPTLPDGWVAYNSPLTTQYWPALQQVGLDQIDKRLAASPDELLLVRDAAKFADILPRALISADSTPATLPDGRPAETIAIDLAPESLVVFFSNIDFTAPANKAVYDALHGPVLTFEFTLDMDGHLVAVQRRVSITVVHVAVDFDPDVTNEAFIDAHFSDAMRLEIVYDQPTTPLHAPIEELADLPAFANPGFVGDPPFPTLAEFDRALNAAQTSAQTEAFWTAVQSVGQMPLIFGDHAIFLYRGPARSVQWAGDWINWQPGPGARLGESDIWYATAQLPLAGRVEYRLVVNGAAEWIPDPLNPLTQPGGFGPNSVVRMPDYQPPNFVSPRAGIASGDLTDNLTLDSQQLGQPVHYRVYTPANYAELSDLPVVYVTDGQDFLAFVPMDVALDNLIADGVIRPLIAVFIDPRDAATGVNLREQLFNDNMAYVAFIADELVPTIDAAYRTLAAPEGRAVIGTSFGGYFVARLALVRSASFQAFGILSPALWVNPTIYDDYPAAPLPVRIFLQTGLLADNTAESRRLRDKLASADYTFTYMETPEGHSYGNWAGVLDDMLAYFFPPSE